MAKKHDDEKHHEGPEVPDPLPTLGRIVHYEDAGGLRAAIVTGVNEDGSVSLFLFRAPGTAPVASANYTTKRKAGCWTWPARS